MTTIKQNSAKLLEQGASFLGTLFQQIWELRPALLNILSLFVSPLSSPSILLPRLDRMVDRVDSWIRAITSMSCANRSRHEYDHGRVVRGQGSLCVILGLYYGSG